MNLLPTIVLFTSKMNATGWLTLIGAASGVAMSFVFQTNTMAFLFVALLLLDFISGVVASLKRGDKITSKKTRDMWYKWITYLVILLTSACLEMVAGTAWIHAAALGWIMLSEGVSILENCESILGKKIPFLSKIKKMLDVLRGNNKEK